MGATLLHRRVQAPPFPLLLNAPHTELTGGGPLQLKSGQVTANSEMAVCIAASLVELGKYDPTDIAQRYLVWKPDALGISPQTDGALAALQMPFLESKAKDLWLQTGKQIAGNQSLARVGPIGIFYARSVRDRIEASLIDSALTHFDPRCQLACVALSAAVAAALNHPGPVALPALKVVAAVHTELTSAAALLGQRHREFVWEIQEAVKVLKDDLALAQQEDPLLYGPELHLHYQEDFIRVAFRLAFWELFHAGGLQAGLLDVVNRGGHSSANGAIAGALLGAVYGDQEIPTSWSASLFEVPFHLQRGPHWELYHPRLLLALSDKVISNRESEQKLKPRKPSR